MSSKSHSKASIIKLDSSKTLENYFKLNKKLGEGTFGVVVSAYDLRDGNLWAIKKIVKNRRYKGLKKSWEREFAILSKIKHPNIIELKEMYETEHFAFLILEYCNGFSLGRQLKKMGKFSDYEASNIIHQLGTALNYLHQRSIVHRDVKLDNILLSYRNEPPTGLNDEESEHKEAAVNNSGKQDEGLSSNNPSNILFDVKLADFGLALELKGQERMIEFCGTPLYMAPEIIGGKSYSKQCDVWSLGIIMFMILTGQTLFKSSREQQLFDEIQNLNIQHHIGYLTSVSIQPLARDCLCSLLHLDPAYRFTMSELLQHKWTQQTIHSSSITSTSDINSTSNFTYNRNVLQLMKDYSTSLSYTNKNEAKITIITKSPDPATPTNSITIATTNTVISSVKTPSPVAVANDAVTVTSPESADTALSNQADASTVLYSSQAISHHDI